MAHATSPHGIVLLGCGTGATLAGNHVRAAYMPDQAEIAIVDHDDVQGHQPGLLFVRFGLSHTEDIVRPGRRQLRDSVERLVS
jgi:NADH dehydrogenase FAD-containing subunit